MFANFDEIPAMTSKILRKISYNSCLPQKNRAVCFSDNHFVSSSPDNQQLLRTERKVYKILEHLLKVITIDVLQHLTWAYTVSHLL